MIEGRLLHSDDDIGSDEAEEEEEVADGLGHQEEGLLPFGISKADLDANYLSLGSPSPVEVSPLRLSQLRDKYPQVTHFAYDYW